MRHTNLRPEQHTPTFEFTCAACETAMTGTFRQDFAPDAPPDFVFCCLGCGRRYRITSWAPLWIVRETLRSSAASRN